MTAFPRRFYLLGLALFLAPAVSFVGRNLHVYSLEVLLPPLGISSVIAIMLFLLCFVSARVAGQAVAATAYVAGAGCWFLQFWYGELVVQMRSFGVESLAAVTILCLAMIISFAVRWAGVQRTIMLFLALNVGMASVGSLWSAARSNQVWAAAPPPGSVASENLKAPSPVQFHPTASRDLNIYYVIMDGLASERVLKQQFGINVSAAVERLVREHSYYVAPAARSSYNTTYLTLSSIFYQTYPVDESSAPFKDRSLFYPRLLSATNQTSLFVSLQALGYQFTHVGNSWAPCQSSQQIRCLSDFTIKASFIRELMSNYAIQSFFVESLVQSLLMRWNAHHSFDTASINDNDALQTFMRVARENPELTKSKRNFFFIHHMNPHPPARDPQCVLLEGGNYRDEDLAGYSSSVQCAFLRIREFTELIAKVDPQAIVVMQADHGAAVNYSFARPFKEHTTAQLDERFSIFNALKVPAECASGLRADLGNVETINFVLGCAGRDLPVVYEPRSYAGFYENRPEFGRVIQAFGSKDAPADRK